MAPLALLAKGDDRTEEQMELQELAPSAQATKSARKPWVQLVPECLLGAKLALLVSTPLAPGNAEGATSLTSLEGYQTHSIASARAKTSEQGRLASPSRLNKLLLRAYLLVQTQGLACPTETSEQTGNQTRKIQRRLLALFLPRASLTTTSPQQL